MKTTIIVLSSALHFNFQSHKKLYYSLHKLKASAHRIITSIKSRGDRERREEILCFIHFCAVSFRVILTQSLLFIVDEVTFQLFIRSSEVNAVQSKNKKELVIKNTFSSESYSHHLTHYSQDTYSYILKSLKFNFNFLFFPASLTLH